MSNDLSNEPGRSQRRFRLQFSLRTMFVVATLVCLWLGVTFSRARQQGVAVDAIESAGGEVVYDWQIRPDDAPRGFEPSPPGPKWLRKLVGPHYFDTVVIVRHNGYRTRHRELEFADIGRHLHSLAGLRSLSLSSWDLEPSDWRMVGQLGSLRELSLSSMEISDEGAAALANCRRLQKLSLNEAVISPAALAEFAKLPNLDDFSLSCKYMYVGRTITTTDEHKLRDEGARAIASYPKLRRLQLYQTLVTDDGVDALCELGQLELLTISSPVVTAKSLNRVAQLKNLEILDIWCWQIEDDDLVALQKLPELRWLRILATPITDGCAPRLAQLDRLESLHLGGDQITDASLPHFRAMHNLERLYLKSTKVDPEGEAVRQLRQALPKCSIIVPLTERQKEMERLFHMRKFGGGNR